MYQPDDRRKFADFSICFNENSKTVLELFKKHTPDSVITDISIKLVDGTKKAKAY